MRTRDKNDPSGEPFHSGIEFILRCLEDLQIDNSPRW